MVGSPRAEIRESHRGHAVFMAARPEEPPGGSQSVRGSDEAGNDRGAKGRRKVDARWKRATKRNRRQWRQRLSKAEKPATDADGWNDRSGWNAC
jgi:hypothetical protein